MSTNPRLHMWQPTPKRISTISHLPRRCERLADTIADCLVAIKNLESALQQAELSPAMQTLLIDALRAAQGRLAESHANLLVAVRSPLKLR